MKQNMIKGIVTTVTGLLSSVLGALYIPVLLMVMSNIIDYATGLMAVRYRNDGGISSYRSMRGICKKISMWLLVVVGAMLDELLMYAAPAIGLAIPARFLIAALVAIWIICNEIISILENMIDIGVKIPKFLTPIVQQIKRTAEEAVSFEDTESEESGDNI